MKKLGLGLAAAALLGAGAWAAARPARAPYVPRLEGGEMPSLSPDAADVAFRVRGRDRRVALYVAACETPEAAVRVSEEPGAETDVVLFAWSPDGGRLAYTSDEAVEGRYELYTVRPSGEDRLRVLEPLPDGRNVVWFSWAPDGRTLHFVADLTVDDRFDLYRVSAAGGDPELLSLDLPEGSDVQAVELGRP